MQCSPPCIENACRCETKDSDVSRTITSPGSQSPDSGTAKGGVVSGQVAGVGRVIYAVMKTDAAKAKLQEQKAAMKQLFLKKKKKSQSEVDPEQEA